MPLRLTLELIPHGDEAQKRVVGVLDVVNDGKSGEQIADYEYRLRGMIDGKLTRLPHGEGTAKDVRRTGLWHVACAVLVAAMDQIAGLTRKTPSPAQP